MVNFTAELMGIPLAFETREDLFSPSAVDRGTLAMLSGLELTDGDKVLDLGCGYGVVGILAARLIGEGRVWMCDLSETAVACAKQNAARNGVGGVPVIRSDGLDAVEEAGFTLILSNPPYHTDFSVAKRFIEGSYRKLAVGGRLRMVTKRRDWYKNKLISVFGGVKVWDVDGYFVFEAKKRELVKRPAPQKEKNKLSKKLARRHAATGKLRADK